MDYEEIKEREKEQQQIQDECDETPDWMEWIGCL